MENKKNNSLEYLFDRIFETLTELSDRMDKTDTETKLTFKELEKTIATARQELHVVLAHYDIITTLSKNLSPEGLKELVLDVIELKKFMTTLTEREEQRKISIERWLKIGIPIFIFALGIGWWLIQNFLIISPK